MALLFVDSFDHCGAFPATTSSLLTKWAAGTAVRPETGGRTANCLVVTSANAALISKPVAASGGFLVGFAVRVPTAFQNGTNFVSIREGATIHMQLTWNTVSPFTQARLNVVRGGPATLQTGSIVMTTGSWYFIEFKGTIHDTTGSYELRIDSVPDAVGTNVDTRNGGATGQWNNLQLDGTSAVGGYQFDDLYLCDLSGGSHNDFLGPVKIEALLPQTGNGTHVGLTPSTGTDHGTLVREIPPNSTDYNSSPTVGAKDTYHYPSLTLTGTILGVQTNLYVAKTDAAARTVCAVVRAGGVDYDGANVAPGTGFGYFSEVRAVNPNTGVAWTPADIAALEAGMKVTA